MTDPLVTLIARTVVVQASTGELPAETVAGAILSDGTYFVAAGIDSYSYPYELIRIWRLAKDLTVMGSLDIDYVGGYPCPSSVALAGNRVLLTSRHSTVYDDSWVIDCNGNDPVIEHHTHYQPSAYSDWWRCGQRHLYDQVNDRVIWAIPNNNSELALQVFRASTGESLCQITSGISTDFLGFIGLHVDPNDATKLIATATSPPPNHNAPGRLAFTVSLGGTSGSFDGITAVYGPGQNWDVAAGNPYLPGYDGILGDAYLRDGTGEAVLICANPLEGQFLGGHHDATGTVMASVVEGTSAAGINTQGDSASLGNGRYLVSYNEQYGLDNTSGFHSYRGALMCVDQATPAVLEVLPLDYFGQPTGHVDSTGGSTSKIAELDVSNESGVIFVVAGLEAPGMYSVLAWAIQGPVGGKPNLAGQLLDDRVRFTGIPS